MKLASYEDSGRPRLAAVDGETLIDLNRAAAARARDRGAALPQALADATVPADVLDFLRAGDDALAAARAAAAFAADLPAERARRERLRLPRADARLLPPVPQPPKIICVGRNYAEHANETGLAVSEIPILFARFATTLVADGDPVVRPRASEQLDWEGELAVVIGTGGRHIPRACALDHVAGYAVFNDVTVRDYQFRTSQYTAGKNFAASGPFGPHLVLKDELPDPHALEISTYVGDERVQHGRTADMLFDVATIVAHLSELLPLEPGDVIPTGTPSGVGFKRTPPRYLVPGDVVRVEIPGVGVLTNPVIDEA